MKKLIAILLGFSLCFVGCEKAENGQSSENIDSKSNMTQAALFTLEDYPIMDGSTANLPMMAQIMSDTCGISLEEAQAYTSCNKTPRAWELLVEGEVDILLVYEAAEETKEKLEKSGVELEITPVGRDALVFINNSDNKIDDLSIKQLVDIYTGKITNWKEVGGEDTEIVPFQRPATSGSQSLFMKLLMKETKPMDAPTELTPMAMGDLIDSIAVYDNSANALGFSVFYYASYMYTKPNLRLMKVNGVEPSNESIEKGKYPLINEYYLVIRKDEPEDSPTRRLYNWILSGAGREAIIKSGYVPMPK